MNDYAETPHRSKKNTKRWCKGKVGREHDVEKDVPQLMGKDGEPWFWADVCRACGKHVSWRFRPLNELFGTAE